MNREQLECSIRESLLWGHFVNKYTLLTAPQKAAIARFMHWFSEWPESDAGDKTYAEKGLGNYRGRHLTAKD